MEKPWGREDLAAMGESRTLLQPGLAPFDVEVLSWCAGASAALRPSKRSWFIPLKGNGTIAGRQFGPVECWLVEPAKPITGGDDGSALVANCSERTA